MNHYTDNKLIPTLRHPEDFSEKLKTTLLSRPGCVQACIVKTLNHISAQARPGILDRITACESCEAAHLLWHEFLDSANSVSSKTRNRAARLLATLDFPLP